MASLSDEDEDKTPTRPTPRRAPAKQNQHATPVRKTSGQKRTPNSAPVRKNVTTKRTEPPTLFHDFLLGRPSPARTGRGQPLTKRKSLDGVKRELRLGAAEVSKVQPPGGVKDRVKQWQKESAGAVVVDPAAPTQDEIEAEEVEKARIRNTNKRPGRRKSREVEDVPGKGPAAKQRSKSAAAPKKRVISDDHWMKRESPTPKESPMDRKGAPIPKDFLTNYKTAQNPPLKNKIQDWVQRNASEEPEIEVTYSSSEESSEDTPKEKKASRPVDLDETPTRRKASRREELDETTPRRVSKKATLAPDNGIRARASKSPHNGIRARPSPEPADDGIRVIPSRDNSFVQGDDGIRVKPSRESSFNEGDDGIRIKPVRKQRRPREESPAEARTPRARSEKRLRPPAVESFTEDGQHDDDETSSWATPSRAESKRKPEKTGSPADSLSEIPFGNSAFSVLDLPLGAEANTTRKPQPKRNPSFTVPKVLKKVYNVGRDIVHEAVEPPRVVGSNQTPPSIESWLKGTSDPFVDQPAPVPASESTLGVPASPSGRRRSYKEDDQDEKDLMSETTSDTSARRSRKLSKESYVEANADTKARATLPSMERSSLGSPSGLHRSPATRNHTPTKSARKVPLKEALLDAFRGESRLKGNAHAEITFTRESYSPPINHEGEEEEDSVIEEEPATKASSWFSRNVSREQAAREPAKPLPAFPRRQAPTTGQHRLSTIASVETFQTGSSLSTTESELSQTTVTQSTIYTNPTISTLSTLSTLSRNSTNSKPALKRRLTKHSDLISVLSLPDTAGPGRAKSIRSARSVRTNRSRLETATLPDLMRELASDETKYLRELKTLVDGVIPVLLTCVLSKSDSAIAAGLFSGSSSRTADASFTKPIVDMGVALERMKSLHNRIPLEDPIALVSWLNSAHKTYDDYLTSWRMGFQDVVVNLAPASPSSSLSQSPTHDEMPRNAYGDVIKDDGERVDVAFLLKRPLVRVKYLCKLVKGINKLKESDATSLVMRKWEDLETKGRRRTKEEAARTIDRAANNTDTTRARDLETLALAEEVEIDQGRQVCAKDSFSLDMFHSTGQRVECEVEMLLRDKPSDPTDAGDVLICAVDDTKKWLLFPPIYKDQISARMGDISEEVIVMVRGKGDHWHEVFLLKTDDAEAASEWIDMLGTLPIPPAVIRDDKSVLTKLSTSLSIRKSGKHKNDDVEIPIGEQRRREAEDEMGARNRGRDSFKSISTTSLPSTLEEDSMISESVVRDLNDAMKKAGKLSYKATNTARARYHSPVKSAPSTPRREPSPQTEALSHAHSLVSNSKGSPDPRHSADYLMSGALPLVSKTRDSPITSFEAPKLSEPIRSSHASKEEVIKRPRASTDAGANGSDGAPPPPPHRIATTPVPKKQILVTETSTQKKSRRASSPLKHEYQPSNASGTSSSSEDESSSSDGSFSDSDDDDELEAADLPEMQPGPGIYRKRSPPPGSLYSLQNTSLAPSNSASQAPYRGVPMPRLPNNQRKIVAMISVWNINHWKDLHPEPCSIVVSDGLIQAFELNASHTSSPYMGPILETSGTSEVTQDENMGYARPLVAQGLTPNVQVRQSTAVDIEIKSTLLGESLLKAPGGTVRYRTLMVPACMELYRHVHRARLNNPVYEQLARERTINSYGSHAYEQAVAGNRRRSWLGRTKSYRASTRAPSDHNSVPVSTSSSTFARLRRLSGGGIFNIAKSTVDPAGAASQYTSGSSNSTFSGPTPPRTPTSPSLSGTMTSTAAAATLGNKDLKIRLYTLVTSTSWEDKGAARLDVTPPLPGQRQRSCLNNGIERRVVARVSAKKGEEGIIVLDEVLGSGCFSRVGRTGIVVNVWEDIKGDNGEVGLMPRVGGVSGRTRKWLFQMGSAAECNWVFGLCATGR